MNKTKLILFWCSILLLSSCGIIIIAKGLSEKVKEHKVEPDTKPSELIDKFIVTSIPNERKNYCLTFYDIYCGYSYQQISFCNKLYEETNNDYEWIAITMYDTITEKHVMQKLGYSNDHGYNYTSYYNVNGLKSSLRNLYHNNEIPDDDIDPMTIIIWNDTIKKIIRGAINTELKHKEHKNFLDSLSRIYY